MGYRRVAFMRKRLTLTSLPILLSPALGQPTRPSFPWIRVTTGLASMPRSILRLRIVLPSNVGQAVTVNLNGQPEGSYRNSSTGTGKSTSFGTSYKYKVQTDEFTETFTGTNGFASGTFSGFAAREHRTEQTRVK